MIKERLMSMEWLNDEILLKLALAALLGLVIGIERELKRKPLGLKTSSVIAVVSCLLTIVSVESAYRPLLPGLEHIQMDPLRLAAQIVSGIGFIGAGVILRRGNDHISGLTTAAMIWGAAGIGIAVGAGFYREAVMVVVLLLVVVELIPFILVKTGPMRGLKKEYHVKISVHPSSSLDQIMQNLKKEKISIAQTRFKDTRDAEKGSMCMLDLRIRVSSKVSFSELYAKISRIPGVESVEMTD
jgi:putative Mg2+ transporter-C (MgtC) family protein